MSKSSNKKRLKQLRNWLDNELKFKINNLNFTTKMYAKEEKITLNKLSKRQSNGKKRKRLKN